MIPGESRPLYLLRAFGVFGALTSAAGSLALLFHASHRRPPLLMLIFVVWVLAPFTGGMAAQMHSSRWSIPVRVTLYSVMLLIGFGSLVLYGLDAIWPRRAQAAFVYVIVPPLSCILIAAALATAFLLGRKDSRQ